MIFQLCTEDHEHKPDLQGWLKSPFHATMMARFMEYSEKFSRVDWSQVHLKYGVIHRTVFPFNFSLRMAAGALGSTDEMLLKFRDKSKMTEEDIIPCAWTNLTRILKGDYISLVTRVRNRMVRVCEFAVVFPFTLP